MVEEKDKEKGARSEKSEKRVEKPAKAEAKKADAPKAPAKPAVVEKGPPPRLWERYRKEVVPQLMRELGETNPFAVPRIEKIVINMGVGKATENEKRMQEAVQCLTAIAGQRPQVTRAKLSVAEFRIRKGLAIGCRVTLRRARMYEFLDRLISVAVPRIRDFRGFPRRSFDRQGNYTFGISEQVIFPEIRADKIEFVQGMDITLCTTGGTPERGLALLSAMGFPLRKVGEKDEAWRRTAAAEDKSKKDRKKDKEKQTAGAK